MKVDVLREELDKVKLLQVELLGKSREDTVIKCIDYAYERILGNKIDSTDEIIRHYRNSIKPLRERIASISKEILKSKNRDEIKMLVEELKSINEVVNITQNVAVVDGNFNDVMFDVINKAKTMIEYEKIRVSDRRNDILSDKTEHEIRMSLLPYSESEG